MDIGEETGQAVDQVDLDAYQWILTHRRIEPAALAKGLGVSEQRAAEAVTRLTALCLVHADASDPGVGHAVAPEAAMTALAAPGEARIRREQERIARGRALMSAFVPHYHAARHERGTGIEVIPTLAEVRAALNEAAARCRSEVMASQPGGGSRVPEAMQEALARDEALLSRGITMRTLYHHTARFNGPSQAYVEAASRLGGQYRTSHELFGRIIVFDRELAFVPASDGSWGAVAIRQEWLVAYLCEIFEQTWARARPFASAAAEGLEQVAQEIDHTIVELLAAGLKDETIARRLGMSLRTARRHIADIMAQLGADSRFQAGVAAAKAGLVPD
ncbi:LuxR C-terminal-related transcriptional regulator [Streptacidiphilus monticola]|uniref:LuxR C-terminal-related transcriptional regulator n=1 Tax=Streptacidiphilus monticola TaxID=2161674 RepID=A0ABW1G4Q8_9ACTN